jgi:hypothetical protein
MEAERFLPCSQEPATGPYPKPDESSPYNHFQFYLQSILTLSPHLYLGLPSEFFLLPFHPKSYLHSSTL